MPPALAELDALVVEGKRRERPFRVERLTGQVRVGKGGLGGGARFEAELERLAKGVDPRRIAQHAARYAEGVEHPDPGGDQPKGLGGGEGLLSPPNRLFAPARRHRQPGDTDVGVDELGVRSPRSFQRIHGFRLRPLRVSSHPQAAAQRNHRHGRQVFISELPIGGDRLTREVQNVGCGQGRGRDLDDFQEQLCALLPPSGAELKRIPIKPLRPFGVEVPRPVAGESQKSRLPSLQLVDVRLGAGCLTQFPRTPVVLGQQLGMVGHALARRTLDPLGSRSMPLRSLGARNLAVGHIPDQGVPERELIFSFDRGGSRRPDEFLAHELAKAPTNNIRVGCADRGYGTGPEDFADDGRVV